MGPVGSMMLPARGAGFAVAAGFGDWQGAHGLGKGSRMQELKGIKVTVDDVLYMPSLEAPPAKPHPFVYFISIRNESAEAVTIEGRKWLVREGEELTVVEGEGVVGQTPGIAPGEVFSYNSYHVIGRDAEAEGAFFGRTESGEWGYVRIPKFRMKVPGQAGGAPPVAG